MYPHLRHFSSDSPSSAAPPPPLDIHSPPLPSMNLSILHALAASSSHNHRQLESRLPSADASASLHTDWVVEVPSLDRMSSQHLGKQQLLAPVDGGAHGMQQQLAGGAAREQQQQRREMEAQAGGENQGRGSLFMAGAFDQIGGGNNHHHHHYTSTYNNNNHHHHQNQQQNRVQNQEEEGGAVHQKRNQGGGGGRAAAAGGGNPGGQQQQQQQASRYESQKRRDWNTFGQYLRNHRPPLALARCSGAHVLEFLRYLDHFGKTKVHVAGCAYYGQPTPPAPCGCPLRQAWGSLDALIGRLRAAFEEHGGRPDANPFGARAVRLYLREVRDLQAKARGIAYEKKKKKTKRHPAAAAATPPTSAATMTAAVHDMTPPPASAPASSSAHFLFSNMIPSSHPSHRPADHRHLLLSQPLLPPPPPPPPNSAAAGSSSLLIPNFH